MPGRLIAVTGPSGVGKDTVMAAMVAAEPDLRFVRRVITRPFEPGGERFDSVCVLDFNARQRAGHFALSWSAHGLSYGIPAAINATLADGQDVLVNLSRAVLADANARFDRLVVLSLTADPRVCADRLAARGREAPSDIARRLVRVGAPVPHGVPVTEINNSGDLADTVRTALSALYPARVQR